MKRRYDLQKWYPFSADWSTIASSHTSPTKTFASYKTSGGRGGYNSIENMKARGERLRMVTTEIIERIVSIEDV